MSDASPRPGSVTVVITTYNHARFLQAALRSALAQTVPAEEIIVIDDGSTDHPEHVTRHFPEVHVIRQANAGLAAARNTGWRAATSEFVVFLDADDRLLPDALAVNVARLAAEPEAGFSYGAYLDVDATAGQTRLVANLPATEGFTTFLRGNPVGMHATVMYRRTKLAEVEGFEAGLPACEDYDLYLRMALRFPTLYSAVPLAEYWHHRNNMSRNSAMMLHAALLVLRRQRSPAKRRAEIKAYREGLVGWKRYYVEVWCLELLRAIRARSIETSLLRQGLSLAGQAPLTVLSTPFRGVRRRARHLQGRIRSPRGRRV